MRAYTLTALGVALLVTTFNGAKAGRFESIVVSGVITQSPSTQNSTTIDTQGIFAPVGTDLAGLKVEILQQYEPAHFGGPVPDGNNALLYPVKAPSPHLPGTILISVTINGVQRVFISEQNGSVITGSIHPDYVSQIEADDTSGNQYAVHLTFTAPVKFGLPFPTQSILETAVVHDFTFYPPDHAPGEYLSFIVNSASR